MEASELRSGVSLVYLNEQVCVVNSVNEHGSIRLTPYTENPKWKYESFSVNGGAVHPIPLTEEILLKCGFESGNGQVYMDVKNEHFLSSFKIWVMYDEIDTMQVLIEEVSEGKDTHTVFIPRNINHLHQLQNLFFSLTGEELNIEL